MKTTLVSAAIVAVLVVGVSLVGMSYGQGPGGPVQANGQNIAVIDVGLVFEKHARFKVQMEQLKAEITAAEKGFQAQAADINRQVDEFKGTGLKPDTQQFHEMEAKLAKLQADFNVGKQLKNKEIMEKQSKIYLRTYQEVEDAVKQISSRYNIALVIRYNSKPIDASDPQQILQGIQRPIVFVDKQYDMTDAVITNVNRGVADNATRPQPQGVNVR